MRALHSLPVGLALAAVLCLGCQPRRASQSPAGGPAAGSPAPFDHALFDRVLRSHVRGGQVDYGALKEKDADTLERYLRLLAARGPGPFAGPDDELAFWLNAYNAFVIAGVLERYPGIRSVREAASFFDERRWQAAGRTLSLNQIENEIIRPGFGDPRIHFVLVCAARSCPPLQPGAMKGASLDADLERATREAVNDTRYVDLDAGAKRLRLTRIMSWYRKDFVQSHGSLEAFLARYLEEPARGQIGTGDHSIEFMDYDWALNDAGPAATRGSGR